MKTAIRKHLRDFAFILGLLVVATGVSGYILSNQRFYLPNWFPVLGSDFVEYKAELETAQSITPGQGQTVNVAGVPVGDIARVDLENGRAVVTMKIRRKYTPIYRDASALLRPKTGLNDMMVELTPGSRRAGELDPDSERIPVSRTLPNINADEVLSALDGDSRDYLKLLVNGAAEGLRGNGRNLSKALRRFEPTARYTLRLTKALAERRENVRRSIHNFGRVIDAVGDKDEELAQLVDSSAAVFRSFARQDARLQEAVRLLPGALEATNEGVTKARVLADELGPAASRLRPAARALGPTLRRMRPFLRETTPVIRDQLRPFARAALPTVRDLRPAARDLAALTPDLLQTLKIVNYLLNELAYNPPGPAEEGYLFWASWANHLGATLFATQDAHGPIRHGIVVVGCSGLETLDQVAAANPQLATLIALLNPVRSSVACAKSAQPQGGGR